MLGVRCWLCGSSGTEVVRGWLWGSGMQWLQVARAWPLGMQEFSGDMHEKKG